MKVVFANVGFINQQQDILMLSLQTHQKACTKRAMVNRILKIT
jgi:hypothetical protein